MKKDKIKTELFRGALCKLADDQKSDFFLIKDREMLSEDVLFLSKINQYKGFNFSDDPQDKRYQVSYFDRSEKNRTIPIEKWVIFLKKKSIKLGKSPKNKTRKRAVVFCNSGLWIVPLHCLDLQKLSGKK